ncbi:zf-CCHC domain-containing protein [Tanacetum coccineum]
MDPNSSLRKICLVENVVEISSDKVEGSGDWDSPEYQDTANSGGEKETKAMVFHKMDTKEIRDRFVAPCFVNGLEAYDGEINLGIEENMISNEYAVKLCLEHKVKIGNKIVKKELIVALRCKIYFVKFIINPDEDDVEPEVIFRRSFLQEVRPVLETMAYHDKYKKVLDEIWKDKVEFDEMIMKEEEEAIKKVKGEALKEKDDPGAFIFPIRLEGQVNANALADTRLDINTMPYRIYEQLGREEMKKVEVTTLIAKFLILDIPIDHDAPIVVGWGFLCMIGGIVNTQERLFSTFDGYCHQTFHAARSDVMRNAESDSDDEEEYEIKGNKFGAPIYGPKPAPYLNCNNLAERSLEEETMLKPDHRDPNALDNLKPWKKCCFHKFTMSFCYGEVATMRRSLVNWDVLNEMGCDREIDDMLRIKLRKAESNDEIFTSVAWIRAFNIKELIYAELCHEFYSTYEFDEPEEDGFDVYFQGGLRSDKHFNAQEYLDTTTLRELIDSEGRLIPEDSQLGVPRVGIPRPPRASMQDLFDRMGSMEIRQEDIKRMKYRQSYHWDRYQGVFEHMAGVYSVPLQGAYNPPDIHCNISSSSRMMMSSVEMTQVGYVAACNSQVKDNNIDLLVQQYEQFTILEEEYIDSGFARFNTIITSLKALDEDLSSLALDELIGNLKVHEVVMEKDSKIYRGKKQRVKYIIASKSRKESSDDESSTSRSDDEEYAIAVRNFKKFFRRKGKFVRQPKEEKNSFRQRDEKKGKSDWKCFRCGDPSHLIGDCPKPSRNKDQKAFIGGSWSDSENDAEDKTNDETCLMAKSLNEVILNSSHYSDNSSSLDNDCMQIKYDSLCEISLKIINKNKILKTKRDLLEKEILELNKRIKKLERGKEIEIACKSGEELKSKNAKLKETQVKFVKFDKSANSLKEMLNNQKSPNCKIGLGFDDSKASTNGPKNMSFVGSSAEKTTDGSTLPGSEFNNEIQFGAYCDAQGITHNFSAPRTPQSNGVVERKNRTLQEMSRTMLNEQSIPQKFWCNAVDTSTYILNRILIRPILGKTPYEIFRGRKPSLEYFKVFGSKCFILNTKDYLTKFDPKSYEGVFLGYSQNSKAYVVLNKHTMKVKESLNVTFDESPPPTKLSPLVDDDVGEEETIRKNTKIVNTNNEEDESIEADEIINIKESKNHPLDQVIGNLNQRTLRSQA